MIYPITFDDPPIFIGEQRKGDIVFFSVPAHFAGPLTDDAKDDSLQICVFVQVGL